MVDPGAARFVGPAFCTLERVTQAVEMPKLSRAEPLVAVTTYRKLTSGGGFDFVNVAVGVGPSWHDDGPISFGQFATARFCLGAANYAPESTVGKGAVTPIELMPSRATFDCADATAAFEIDHMEIKPADPGECPAPGSAVNGDVEGDGGWSFNVSFGNGPDLSTAMIEPGVGEAGTKGVRLFMNHRCDLVSTTNAISVPDGSTLASPAISIFNRASSGASVNWSIGGVPLPNISGSGQPTTTKFCVPAFMRGGAFPLRANIDQSGACMDTPNFAAVFDNFRLVNEPSCGTDATITDPGFESALTLIGATFNQGRSLSRTLQDPANAHSGNGVLQLSVTQLCEDPRWIANVITPASTAAGGPALHFFYKSTPPANYQLRVIGSGGPAFAGIGDNSYHEGVVCLNPKLVGRNQGVVFSMSGGSGTCATVIPAETAFVDDLQVTSDPMCPGM
ncbi:MAG TPA: hypothetical protein VFQ53_30040 [Kofleriaceae bacterium]|nr:hypothetical protein [Kofleriaceae bacterium]